MRRIVTLLIAMAAATLSPGPLAAQDTTGVLDSIAERLERAEQALERLQRQLEEQQQAKVGSRLRNHVTLSGLVLANAFYNNAGVNNSDAPQFVTPPDTLLPNRHVGAAIRQTRIGLTVSSVQALGAILTADLQLDFFGGQQPGANGRTSPLIRIRTATMRLDWPHVGLLLGQETPLVSPNNPVSFAASGIPGFTAAGNLWLWIPQARLTVETGGTVRFGIQGAALSPTSPTPQPAFVTEPDPAERSGRPTAQGRVYVGWGDGETESQLGFGVHRGWIAVPGDSLLTSEALTADWRIALGDLLLLHGEAFFEARAVAGLGGGGVGQNLGAGGVPVRTRGGWVQLNIRPSFALEIGGGAGVDDPDEADLPATGRGRNITYEGHVHWRPGGGLLFGFEFRRMETRYAAGTLGANHLNWFAGVAF